MRLGKVRVDLDPANVVFLSIALSCCCFSYAKKASEERAAPGLLCGRRNETENTVLHDSLLNAF